MNDTIKSSGKTVEEAIEKGLEKMGAHMEDVEIHIVEEPSRGFMMGLIGKKQAVVELVRKTDIATEEISEPEPVPGADETDQLPVTDLHTSSADSEEKSADERTVSAEGEKKKLMKPGKVSRNDTPFLPEEQLDVAEKAKVFLTHIFSAMNLNVVIEKMISQERILLNLHGKNLGILIGKHGQTLEAIQYLTNMASGRDYKHHYFVLLDIENYRERRKKTLESLAQRLAEKARRNHTPVKLEPMSAYDRRIIHLALQEDSSILTESEGEEPYRCVVIKTK